MTELSTPLIVFGDLHGHLDLFERLLAHLDARYPQARLVGRLGIEPQDPLAMQELPQAMDGIGLLVEGPQEGIKSAAAEKPAPTKATQLPPWIAASRRGSMAEWPLARFIASPPRATPDHPAQSAHRPPSGNRSGV